MVSRSSKKQATKERAATANPNYTYKKLKAVPFHVLSVFKNLTVLNLSHNHISFLPPEFFDLLRVEVLHLSHNEITELDPNFGRLAALRILNLSSNRLTSLGVDDGRLHHLSQLKRLDLGGNLLGEVPQSICKLRSLERLILKNNQIEKLPQNFGNLESVLYLSVSSNSLVDISPIFSLPSLQGLAISKNDRLLPQEEKDKLIRRFCVVRMEDFEETIDSAGLPRSLIHWAETTGMGPTRLRNRNSTAGVPPFRMTSTTNLGSSSSLYVSNCSRNTSFIKQRPLRMKPDLHQPRSRVGSESETIPPRSNTMMVEKLTQSAQPQRAIQRPEKSRSSRESSA